MRINEHTAIITKKVLLVPYETHHVPKYHEWMQDEELREATASEPLTLEEEYAMQRSWREDKDKLTFIACLPSSNSNSTDRHIGQVDHENMIGDVNLFLSYDDTEGSDPSHIIGELEIMVARKDLHAKGYGRTILLTFLWYVLIYTHGILQEFKSNQTNETASLAFKMLRVRIGSSNEKSIRLFETLGFHKIADAPNYFGEWELQWQSGDEQIAKMMEKVNSQVGILDLRKYCPEEHG
ncbi:hypothetical protein NA57DRAFT_75859 [Rhizodiscina lignyota]|uniref:N-acetyltransferase domain-containing protein n=1 Tax=Rhizodiscina lignyota TaxID=1504668 RepID=A0A9P4M5C7_9PEZI|nr:hypothetical protein NA57DRAFT_75859 [Rhizodiscina lignyota]